MDALLQSPEPTRVSARKRLREQLRDVRVAVGLKAVGGKVQLGLAVAEIMPDDSPGPEELMQYHDRSAGVLKRKRRKFEIRMRSGLHAIGCESEVRWSDIIARCEAAASNKRARPRGASLANRVGVQRRRRPDRHIQRREQQAQRLQAQVKAAKAYRESHIKKLRGILLGDNTPSLLRQPEGAPVAVSKLARGRREADQSIQESQEC